MSRRQEAGGRRQEAGGADIFIFDLSITLSCFMMFHGSFDGLHDHFFDAWRR
jgi:hypothetical protein